MRIVHSRFSVFAMLLLLSSSAHRCRANDALAVDSVTRSAEGTQLVLVQSDTAPVSVSLSVVEQNGRRLVLVLVKREGKPLPPMPPVPPIPPLPDIPDGKFALSATVRNWVLEEVKLASESRRLSARALAGSFRGISAAIAAGTLREPADILAETKKQNQLALGNSAEAFKPFAAKLADKLETLSNSNSLISPEDYSIAWNEIALGLEAVP